MDKRYKVEIKTERNGRDTYLAVTHNGYQWASIFIREPTLEMPLIINALKRHLMPAILDNDDHMVLKKSSILWDEETFNNGIGW